MSKHAPKSKSQAAPVQQLKANADTPAMSPPAFQLKAAGQSAQQGAVQMKVSPDYNKIKSLLSYGIGDWAVTDGEVTQVLSMMNNLSDVDLKDTVNKLKSDVFLDRLISNLTDASVRHSHQALYWKLLERINQIKSGGKVKTGPAKGVAPIAVGNDFNSYLKVIGDLEAKAKKDGYTTVQIVTALRKIYYNSATQKEYGGTTVGGGAWGILIPGAAGTGFPPSWQDAKTQAIIKGLKKTQEIDIGGKKVDIGHLFAGVDAINHPTAVNIAYGAAVSMRSNIEAATWSGDLGSVVGEYILKDGADAKGQNKQKFHSLATKRQDKLLKHYLKSTFSDSDLRGDVDAYNFHLDHSKSVTENLRDYYSNQQAKPVSKRFTEFAKSVGLMNKDGSYNDSFKTTAVNEVFEATMAYVASKGRKGDILLAKQGPKAFQTTFWDLYFNVTSWCVDLWIQKIKNEIKNE